MLSRLPPAGNRIILRRRHAGARGIEDLFDPYRVRFYHSGTAALAAALVAAVSRHGLSRPEVLLPAYACPDLVSAALYAGVRPVLVDLAANTPWLDLSDLEAKITRYSVAVIGVNFLGIPERLEGLRAIADRAGILLIEDSAQCLFDPSRGEAPWGDFVVQSFGRGKPVSLLQGGAVICRDAALADTLPVVGAGQTGGLPGRATAFIKILLYNLLLSPSAYALIDMLPFLHIGETRFRPLPAIRAADALVSTLLPANIAAYRERSCVVQDQIGSMLEGLSSTCVTDLARGLVRIGRPRLLRFPLLVADEHLRDTLYLRMKKAGLGASRMYPAPLPGIAGLGQVINPGAERYPGAEGFARSILTLPTHDGVEARHIKAMETLITQTCADAG
jgi:dTDP-4-amino-4,6-dideoxygalactose transaminase